jgi:hypothetical protein
MALLIIYGNNARVIDEDIDAMRASVGSYLVARLSGVTAHLVYSFSSYHHRAQQRLWVVLSLFSLCLFVPLFVEDLSLRSKAAVAWVAIIIEESIWFFSYSPIAKRLLKAKYTTAVDVPHEVDRFAAFFIIVLGEFLYRIIVGSPAIIGFNPGLLHAIWTLIIAFCLNWMYVHGSGSLEQIHPLKHSVIHAYAWVFLHLPLVACLLAGGHAAATTAAYHEEYHHQEMWLLCGGLGGGVIMLWLIASLGECGDAPGVLILPKVYSTPSLPIPFFSYTDIILTVRSAHLPSDNRHHHLLPSTCSSFGHYLNNFYHYGPVCVHSLVGEYHVTSKRFQVLGEMGGYGISESFRYHQPWPRIY